MRFVAAAAQFDCNQSNARDVALVVVVDVVAVDVVVVDILDLVNYVKI